MSTYTQLQSRIADDLNRTDLTSQIQQCILLAIQHYKHERFWFNETSATATASIGSAQVGAPSDILQLDHLYLIVSSLNVELIAQDFNSIVQFRPTSNGRPLAYCYYRNQFELDRKCDLAYSMLIYYVKELTALSAGTDSNGWTTDGEDLIVFHAEKKLYANVLKEASKAQFAAVQELAALTAMRALRNARTSTGYTKAYYL